MNHSKWILRFLLVSTNLTILFSGVCSLMIGILIARQLITYGFFLDGKVFISPILVIISALLVVVFIVFLGLFGIIQNNRVLLMTYVRFLVVVAILQLTASAVAYSCRSDTRNIYSDTLKKIVYNPERFFDPMDRLQRNLECCGYYGPWDYIDRTPRSCRENNRLKIQNKPHQRGCKLALKEYLNSENDILSGISLGIIVVEVAGIVITCLVDETIRRKKIKKG